MSIQIQSSGHEGKSGILSDPGNMLIVCYLVVVLFFLLLGGLGAAKFSSGDVHETSTVISDTQQTDTQRILQN